MDYCDANGKRGRQGPAPEPQRIVALAAGLCLLCLLLVACELRPPATGSPSPSLTPGATPASPGAASEESHLAVVKTTADPDAGIDTPAPYDYTEVVEAGPLVLDPILAQDEASRTIVRNVMETLVYPHPRDADSYVPLLATGWRISAEGRTYTFSIRRGVHFSDGDPLTASDIAYSLQRLLLASPPSGPQHLLLEPLLGFEAPEVVTETTGIGGDAVMRTLDVVSSFDEGIYSGDRAALLDNVSDDALFGVCQALQAAIVANDGDATLTIRLARPWRSLLSVLSQTWTSAVDRQWAVERGAWDGRCDTWQNWYALRSDESALATAILGTGPYMLDYWTPGGEYVLTANEDYWREEYSMWAGGPTGNPALSSVRVKQVADANARWQLLESGAAQTAALSSAGMLLAQQETGVVCDWQTAQCQETSEGGPLRRIENVPQGVQQALFFNFDIVGGENGYIGSGQLDGDGIPPDFFVDMHVRKAFAYCLDDRTFVDAGLNGEGILPPVLFPPALLGDFSPPDAYPYLLKQCTEELTLAWGGQLPRTGFRVQLPFAAGNAAEQAAAVLLQNNLRIVNPNYQVEAIGLPAPLLQQALRERRAPLALLSWMPALPDAYYWMAPAFGGDIAAFQSLPWELQTRARGLLDRLQAASDAGAREQIYGALTRFYEENVPFLLLPRPATTVYQRRELTKWLINAADPLPYYYAYAMR